MAVSASFQHIWFPFACLIRQTAFGVVSHALGITMCVPLEAIFQPHLNSVTRRRSWSLKMTWTQFQVLKATMFCIYFGPSWLFRGRFRLRPQVVPCATGVSLLTFVRSIRATLVTSKVHTSPGRDVLAPAVKFLFKPRRLPWAHLSLPP